MKRIVLVIALLAILASASFATADEGSTQQATYQGKTVIWWAKHAQQARKDANARAVTIKRLRGTLGHDPSIEECIQLATIAYPSFTEARAWQIINHESQGNPNAKNPRSTASGLYQFLTSTFASTPYGRAGMSIWSPCASSLAAGWMHQTGRGREWAIGSGISGN